MSFIIILMLTTLAIAGSAAFFSVYGLMQLFSGISLYVMIMASTLEAGKLVAASYLYRYWTSTHALLRGYLIVGILALMLLTSVGIFGLLSVGYQQDVLPLKMKTEQVQLLEEEKARITSRKQQIDNLMSGSVTVSTVEGAKGIDRNAVRALRETTRARESLVKQYKVEQKDVTERLKQLDTELLVLRQDLIKVEAHIGPITYIAKVFDQPTDAATKWLIFLIIFAFDPMAVALTLAVNTALRVRREEKEKADTEEAEEIADSKFEDAYTLPLVAPEPLPEEFATVLHDNTWDIYERGPVTEQEPLEWEPVEPIVETPPVVEVVEEVGAPAPTVRPAEEVGSARRSRPYTALWSGDHSDAKINELVNYYQHQTARINSGDALSNDEQWELDAVKSVLQKAGFSQYL